MRSSVLIAVILSVALLLSCTRTQEGKISGAIVPPGQQVRITAINEGKETASSFAAVNNGSFKLSVAPGTYEVHIVSSASPFPLILNGITVRSGETTFVGSISMAPSAKGTASISGRIAPAVPGLRLSLSSDGVERASVAANAEGRYEFEGVSAGSYTVQATSPGYANDSERVTVTDGQKASVSMRMFYVTALDGVDWDKGIIRVRGVGLPPQQAPTPTIRREMAKRAATLDAERNLLRVIEMVQTGPGESLSSLLGEKNIQQKLQGYLQGYRIVADRDLDGGKVEVELELSLTGPGGLSAYLPPR